MGLHRPGGCGSLLPSQSCGRSLSAVLGFYCKVWRCLCLCPIWSHVICLLYDIIMFANNFIFNIISTYTQTNAIDPGFITLPRCTTAEGYLTSRPTLTSRKPFPSRSICYNCSDQGTHSAVTPSAPVDLLTASPPVHCVAGTLLEGSVCGCVALSLLLC